MSEGVFAVQCTDSASDSQLPTVQYNFRHIADLESIEPNQLVGELTCTKKSIYSNTAELDLSIGGGFI